MTNYACSLVAFFSLCALASGAEVNPQSAPPAIPPHWHYSHPKAQVVFGVDTAALLHSKLGEQLLAEFEKSGLSVKASQEGLDLISGVQSILVSSPGVPKAAGRQAKADDAPVVIALTGEFDLAKIRSRLAKKGARNASYRGAQILHRPGDTDMQLALVDNKTLLLGEIRDLRAAMDQHAAFKPEFPVNPLLARGAELSRNYSVWFVSSVPPSAIAGNSPQAKMFEGVTGLEGGVRLDSGLGLELAMDTANADSARKMASGLQGLLMLAAAGAKDQPGVGELMNKLRIGSDQKRVQVTIQYSEQELMQGYESFRAGLVSPKPGAASASRSVAKPAPVAVVRQPEPLVVRIYNAEGGTREVPLNQD